jgi:cyclopropane-fatty-acyl-phospholipid synthase
MWSLEEAQWRKLDYSIVTVLKIKPGQTVSWMWFLVGTFLRTAKKFFGCKVTGITLSVEQEA